MNFRTLKLVVCCTAVLLGPLAAVIHDAHAETDHHDHPEHVCEMFGGLAHIVDQHDHNPYCAPAIHKRIVAMPNLGLANPCGRPSNLFARSPPHSN